MSQSPRVLCDCCRARYAASAQAAVAVLADPFGSTTARETAAEVIESALAHLRVPAGSRVERGDTAS